MRNLTATGILAVAYLLTGGCSGYDDPIGPTNTNSGNGATGSGLPASNVALFEPVTGVLLGTLPFPTDLYFANSTDGTLNIQPPNPFSPNQTAVNAIDGFSTSAVIREPFGGALKASSLTAGSIVIIPVVTDNTLHLATVGVAGPPLVLGTDFAAAPAADSPSILEITPLHPLMPSTCIKNGMFLGASCTKSTGYLVVLNKGITDTSGNAAVPDADYATIQKALATGSCNGITNATLNGICQLVGAHMQVIAGVAQAVPALAPALNPANIVLTFSFTTESTTDTLELLSATTKPTTIKANPTPITTAQVNPALPGHANIYVGVLTVPYYLSKAAPLTGNWQAPPFPLDMTSTNVTRFNPLPVPTQNLLIPVLLTVPNAKSAGGGTPPAGGWPVLIYQHGVLSSREEILGVADSFADAGFVVAGIDLPLHGVTSPKDPFYASAANPLYAGLGLPAAGSIERTFDLDLNTNDPNDPHSIIPGSPADGVTDPSGVHYVFSLLLSPLTFRDDVRQSVADIITFERTLPSLNLGAAGTINATGIHYLGHSGGAIVGAVLMGVVPSAEVSTATLANPGGPWSVIAQTSPYFSAIANPLLAAQGAPPGTTLYAQFFRDVQTVVDAGDPINYIGLATAQHPTHIMQVVGTTPPPAGCNPATPPDGCPDQVVPNATTQLLITASAYGPGGAATTLTQIKAAQAPVVMNPIGIRGYVNFLGGDHDSIFDDVNPAVTKEMQIEAISFTGAAIPPFVPANAAGSTLLLANPAVIQ